MIDKAKIRRGVFRRMPDNMQIPQRNCYSYRKKFLKEEEEIIESEQVKKARQERENNNKKNNNSNKGGKAVEDMSNDELMNLINSNPELKRKFEEMKKEKHTNAAG